MPLKKVTSALFVILLFTTSVSAQEHLPFNPGAYTEEVLVPWIAPAVGYTFSYDAMRFSVITSNLVLKRVGAYVTVETGTNGEYFSNIWGGTLSVTKHAYVWGGMDLFTSHGVINGFKSSRKEIGLGLKPWKGLVLNVGWSGNVRTTFSAGWAIPLSRD